MIQKVFSSLGGEAGLHPSNVHDCEYAIGAINFMGDFPVILTQDGPSLGGFVCPVSEAELDEQREAFREGRAQVRIEHSTFDFAEYQQFLADNATSIEAFQRSQKAAFDAEVPLWQDTQSPSALSCPMPPPDLDGLDGHLVSAEMSGSVWKVLVEDGQWVEAGTPLLVVEAMKMELAVTAPVSGRVTALYSAPGNAVTPGDALLLLSPSAAA